MKFICLKNDANKFSIGANFTPGQVYEATFREDSNGYKTYYLINDKGRKKMFSDWMLSTERFQMVELEQYRNEQIDQLLSEPFEPQKSIIERYGSKETIRDIKIDKILK